jgi:hypothetical protein
MSTPTDDFDRIDCRVRHLKVLCWALLVMVALLLVQAFAP